ncbi:HAD-IA family hydrolase [Roseovarius sp. SYSU LYC5161]|uniref:HAD-IA family hydrolase n=1 Tax=Roseovarius halophilus (ex Wu et al. 2025) TaxID=3376060 RepID=UPI003999D0B7
MTAPLRLIVFDVDGTLVDSQRDIVGAMRHAFATAGVPVPERSAILRIVGLSLDVAIPRLAPDTPPAMHRRMVDWYKDAYVQLRSEAGAAESSPLYDHAQAIVEGLHAVPGNILGIATGKSRRGLDKLLDGHGIRHLFLTQQVSDHHPSKPHPSMLHAAMDETGIERGNAVMIGDTSYDMEMARAAGVTGIGVGWGYHGPDAMHEAAHVLEDFRDLPEFLENHWRGAA